MSDKVRVAVLGLSHDHVWWDINWLRECPEIEVVAAADPHPPLRARFTAELGGQTYLDPDMCLDAVAPDLVLCCDTNRRNVELVELAASRRLPCIVEKPMANRLAGADRMLTACDEAGVPLIINWPNAWNSSLYQAVRLAQSGELGPVWQCRYHAAHNGPREEGCSEYFWGWLYDQQENGPGALMDYCCYGAALCRWLQGVPEAVMGMAGQFLKSEPLGVDNAVLMLRYPNAISLCEASWTQLGGEPFKGATINCRDGAILPRRDGVYVTSKEHPQGEPLPAEHLPPQLESLGHYALAILRGECEPMGVLDPRISRDAQAILEAGILSVASGRAEAVEA
jgi:predicted dehydrogenase